MATIDDIARRASRFAPITAAAFHCPFTPAKRAEILSRFTNDTLERQFDRLNEHRRTMPDGHPWRIAALAAMLEVSAEQDKRRGTGKVTTLNGAVRVSVALLSEDEPS